MTDGIRISGGFRALVSWEGPESEKNRQAVFFTSMEL